MSESDPVKTPVMQTTCVHCGQEQYGPSVYGISVNREACAWCGTPGISMTEDEYLTALTKLREKRT